MYVVNELGTMCEPLLQMSKLELFSTFYIYVFEIWIIQILIVLNSNYVGMLHKIL